MGTKTVHPTDKFISFLSHLDDRWCIRAMEVEEIWIGDYLPTVYEVAQTIFHYVEATKTKKRASVISNYTNSLRNVWVHRA